MIVSKPAVAGTLESNDCYVTVLPNHSSGIQLVIRSIVMQKYGHLIEKTIREVLEEYQIEHVSLTLEDKGALDFTIKARVKTALERSA